MILPSASVIFIAIASWELTMIKSFTVAAMMMTAAGLAQAAPLPAPPVHAYTPTAATSECASETIVVYFPQNTSALTPASHAVLHAAQARLDGCIVGQVSLNATADDAKNTSQGKALKTARLEAVSTALNGYELSGMRLVTEDETLNADTLWTPMDRKVEITLTAWAPEIS